MIPVTSDNPPARFCWLDLAAVDARRAGDFYTGMFGWRVQRHSVNGGEYFRLEHNGEVIASLYQLQARQVEAGVPSHWTPYVSVTDVEAMAARAVTLGGSVVVNPFRVDEVALVSLVTDSAGALFGLWERPR